MKSCVRSVLVGMLVVSLASAPAAQSPGFSAADSKELASYRLSMDTAKKVFAAMRSVIVEMQKDPQYQAMMKLEAEIEALERKDDLTDAESERLEKLREQQEQQEAAIEAKNPVNLAKAGSIDEMEADIKRHPQAAAALQRVGVTPREFSRFLVTMFMAGMVAGFQKSGMLKEIPKELKEIHPDNVKFMLDNQAELEAMQKELAALGKGKG